MTVMMKRCLKLYVRDRGAVFFSLLGVLVIFALYKFFIGDSIIRGLDFLSDPKALMNEWVVAGMLSCCGMTTSLGAYGILVSDRAMNAVRDFHVSPVTTGKLLGGYMAAGFIVSAAMSVLTLVLGIGYILLDNGFFPGWRTCVQLLGICMASAFASSALTCFLVVFLKTVQAYTTVSILVGTLIGFLTGSYICIGDLPKGIQWLIKCFPAAHAAAWMRRILMKKQMDICFAGMNAEVLKAFQEQTGVVFTYRGVQAGWQCHLLVLLGTGVLFYLLSAAGMRLRDHY